MLLSAGIYNQDNHTTTVTEKKPGNVLMAVVAHPDDELLMGALLSHYETKGVSVHVVVATNGALGHRQNH